MYSRPNLSELVQRVRTDVLSRLHADDALRRQDAQVYAQVLAGATHGLYGFIDWLSNQLIYDTAEQEYLERWSAIWGIARKAASAATGDATFTVEFGAVVPAGTLLQALNGQQYQTTADSLLAVPNTGAPIKAVTPGAAGNDASWQDLSLVSPIVGVQSTAVADLLSGGSDAETDDALRARLLLRIRQPPLGGAASDYISWALEVPGVTRAWVYPNELGLGTVTLRFVRDNDGMDAAIIPDEDEVSTVQSYIDTLRPVTAQLTVAAPIAAPLNFEIANLNPNLTTNTASVQEAIEAELRDLLLREATPGGTVFLSHIRAAIFAAAAANEYELTSPKENVSNATGHMSTMGSITWL